MKLNTHRHNTPDYNKIYYDLLSFNFPEKLAECQDFLNKKDFSQLDVILLNEKIFVPQGMLTRAENQKLRSYSKATIFKILDYQKKKGLNNAQLARHFNLSRNTVTKWKKIFC